jgi:hypothetical protein
MDNTIVMEKDDNIRHIERQPSSHDSEKDPQRAYPLEDEDYVVTFKTWVVVTILASAYGVC